jgi:hypothetical protein
LESRYANSIVLPHHDKHRNNPPRWYLELLREPPLVNAQNKAVGLGSFFKRHSYNYTNEELNLPQGHADHICTIDLTPKDQKRCENADDDSVLPTD